MVVIGGGSVGAATLYSLSTKGVKGVLVERNQVRLCGINIRQFILVLLI